tara:strand:- start:7938 stop:8534 length:597 start_codon:yes stop_codon:yes gene_type:complete
VQKILFFSSNKNKIKEIKNKLKNYNIKIITIKKNKEVSFPTESGLSFNENASIKSNFGFKIYKIPCFADDSGICISALKNMPGIASKKFLKSFKTESEGLQYILDITKKKMDFDAYFYSSIAFTINNTKTIFFNGIVKGLISQKPLGLGGFGYDPIFIPRGKKNTFAEMTIEEKNNISHRSIAINKFINYLTKTASPL